MKEYVGGVLIVGGLIALMGATGTSDFEIARKLPVAEMTPFGWLVLQATLGVVSIWLGAQILQAKPAVARRSQW